MRVLLVEDELLISMMLEDELALLGHCVAGVATTVEGGLALLQQPRHRISLSSISNWPMASVTS